MKTSFIAAVAALLFFSGQARAFNHLTGEDTLFLGKDNRKIQAGLEYSVAKGGPDRYSTGAFAILSYGIWHKLDVQVTVPWRGWNSRGISESGLGDVSLEGKLQVAHSAAWTYALKPGFSLPAGNEAKSLGAGKGGVWLYGIAGRAGGPWQFYLNAGYMLNRNISDEEENIFKGSAAAILELLPKLHTTAELEAATSTDKNSLSHPVYSVFGLVWSPYPTLDLDAGLRLGLTRAADDYALLGGLTLRI